MGKDDDGLRREYIDDAGGKDLRQRAQQSWLSPENSAAPQSPPQKITHRVVLREVRRDWGGGRGWEKAGERNPCELRSQIGRDGRLQVSLQGGNQLCR